ncbi:MAG: DUF86 domain-containing protein [Thermodesulfobacteriota bacterium]
MSRDKAYLADMLISARWAVEYLARKIQQDFYQDKQCQDAVIRRLEIIGEAARRVSEQVRLSIPGVPWQSLIGMRNVLIHEYDGVDLDIIWETVKRDLPGLITSLESVVPAGDIS